MKKILATLGFIFVTGQAHASTLPSGALKVTDSGAVRKVDCGGRDLIITGDDNRLTVSGCAAISVVGNHNKIAAKLIPESTIATLGDNNHVVFAHAPGVEVQVSSTGKGNEIVPDMGRDLTAISPVKFPIAH